MAYKAIILKGAEFCPSLEAVANETFYPGHWLELDSSLKFNKQDESGTIGPKLIAVTDRMQGKKISEAYSANYRAFARMVQPGCEVYTWLAKGHSVTAGDYLEFAGYEEEGCLGSAQFTSGTKGASVVAQALETVDNSAGTTAVRIRVLVI